MAASPTQSNQEQCTTPPEIPFASVTVASHGAGASSRRLPPPCWSHDETVALIDAYRDKWYSLRRGNLRANHWQEVAEDIAVRCPVDPPKTSMQCRHKMEKLRKRYRAEIQRAASYGGGSTRRYCSTWIHFKRMDAMERGPDAASPPQDEEEFEDEPEDFKQNSVKHIGDIYSQHNLNSNKRNNFQEPMSNGGAGFRIRIPSARPIPTPPMAKPYSKIDEMLIQFPNPNPNPNHGSSRSYRRDGVMKKEKASSLGKRIVEEVVEKRNGDPIAEAVAAIKMLGEGLVRVENMKMDVARELEQMKMEMEMKKTEMILESQQKIVEAFAMSFSEKNPKKARRMPTPEC
ncbi:PREDICTED: trihelix transcription factor ASIL2 [Ipomoea nil]|uniref:trihelix transcription factor ASIL2 n=1 Tax=Ipomoea nil TaxID=35883 RepID=UPI000900A438|nr:PREDICTED: trihelix transcription factor ASIL2 [Ipomoea nil]